MYTYDNTRVADELTALTSLWRRSLLDRRIYRETPAGAVASEEDSQEGQEETWELLLDDMSRFRLFMSTAKKSKVPCECLFAVFVSSTVPRLCYGHRVICACGR